MIYLFKIMRKPKNGEVSRVWLEVNDLNEEGLNQSKQKAPTKDALDMKINTNLSFNHWSASKKTKQSNLFDF